MMMGTLRTSTNVRLLTVVLPALLATVIEFCLFPYADNCVVFFFAFSSCSCLGGKKEGTLSFSVVALDLPLSLLYCAFSLCTCKLTTSTTAAVLKVC